MLSHRLFDKSIWIVALSALLTLSGASLFFCPTAQAGSAVVVAAPSSHRTPTEASKTALTLDVDDDGNELLEHWGDPKYGREERFQLALIGGGLLFFGTAGAWRRNRMRRVLPHG